MNSSDNKDKSKKYHQTKEKCFIIMPISNHPEYPKDHFKNVYEQIFIPAIESAGYEPYRVDSDNICDDIIKKIFDAVQECPMALCDLSSRNPNVLYELGLRQAYDKPVVLVQDEVTTRIFDISSISTVTYKSTRLYEEVMEARAAIESALVATKQAKGNNTLIKVVKAKTAIYDNKALTQEDTINIHLSSIMNELDIIKNRMSPISERTSDFRIYRYDITIKYIVQRSDIERISNYLYNIHGRSASIVRQVPKRVGEDIFTELVIEAENSVDIKELKEYIYRTIKRVNENIEKNDIDIMQSPTKRFKSVFVNDNFL